MVLSKDAGHIKDARTTLRRIQEHIRTAHLKLGAQTESAGFAEIVYHPDYRLGTVNYVMPRRNTAFISASHVANALNLLREKGRTTRVFFADGLYLPVFETSLQNLSLQADARMPVLIARSDYKLSTPALPASMRAVKLPVNQGMAVWWYAWRNTRYNIVTTGFEPLMITRDARAIDTLNYVDLILYDHYFPVGVVRLSCIDKTAHILALALLTTARTDTVTSHLRRAAVDAAFDTGCDLVFTAGTGEQDRQILRDEGYTQAGSMVTYAEESTAPTVPGAPLLII